MTRIVFLLSRLAYKSLWIVCAERRGLLDELLESYRSRERTLTAQLQELRNKVLDLNNKVRAWLVIIMPVLGILMILAATEPSHGYGCP
jgi:hypothetical protein